MQTAAHFTIIISGMTVTLQLPDRPSIMHLSYEVELFENKRLY